MFYQIFSKIYEIAAEKMCLACEDFIKRGSKILDLGCGSGIVGNKFKNFFQAEVIGVDIIDKRILPLLFEIIDGEHLPFPDKYFDVVLINYVLHHTKDPRILLMEAKRVGKRIIIFEDLPEGFLSKFICKLHGISYGKFFNDQGFKSFNTEENWKKIFTDLNLNIIFKKKVKNFPQKKELFVLET